MCKASVLLAAVVMHSMSAEAEAGGEKRAESAVKRSRAGGLVVTHRRSIGVGSRGNSQLPSVVT